MRNKILLKILIILGVIVFTARLTSHLFLFLAENQDGPDKIRYLKASHRLFPLDYFSAYKIGFGWLERGFYENDNTMLGESIRWFKKSITLNPVFHFSHHHLGKAYLFHNYPNSEYFNEGVAELKQAIKIYQHNKYMIKDISEVFLSMWPLLSKTDQELCRTLLLGLMPRVSWEEFKPLVKLWGLYSKDRVFLTQLMQRRPDFLDRVAFLILTFKEPLALRWNFLAGYESYLLKDVVRQYRAGNVESSLLDFENSLLNRLRLFRSYYRLAESKIFDHQMYQRHKQVLIRSRIRELLKEYLKTETGLEKEIRALLLEYIQCEPEIKELTEIETWLEQNKFFKSNDFKSLYIKYRLKFSQSILTDIIDEIETIKYSIEFINPGHRDAYINLLLLLSDTYEVSKLLTIADQTLREILKIAPDNHDAWFRMVRIQRVLGDKDIEIGLHLSDRIEMLDKSRFVTVVSIMQINPVYLLDKKPIQIYLEPEFSNQLREKKIIQVFVDGYIVYEEYIEKLPEVIELDLSELEEMQKVMVEVKFL